MTGPAACLNQRHWE
jgi:hypothetical protein